MLWAGTDDGNIQVTTDGGAKWTNVTPPADQAVDAHLQHRRGSLRHADRVRRGEHDAHRRLQSALLAHARRRQDVDGDQHRHRARARWRTRSAKIRARRDCSTPRPTRRCGSRSTTAITGSRCGSTCRRSRCATPGEGRQHVPVLRSRRRHARPRLLDSRQRDAAAAGGAIRAARERGTRICEAGDRRCACASATNDPTPWPPEMPAGENPPPGGDHRLLPRRGCVGAVSSSRSSTRRARWCARTRATIRSRARIRRSIRSRTTSCASRRRRAPDCGLPLYWPAPPQVLVDAGGHASLQLGPALPAARRGRRRRARRRSGAVPHRTYYRRNSPWARRARTPSA